MYYINVHKRINQITLLFYRFGLRNSEEKTTVKETRLKLFYSIYFLLFPISLIKGAFSSEKRDDFVFLFEVAVMTIVLLVKLFYIICKKKQILKLLNRICVYSVKDHEEFTLANDTLKSFTKSLTIFMSFIYPIAVCSALVIPFLGEQKKLFFNIGFPLDYNNNDIAYWMAFTFVTTETFLSSVIFLFSIVKWYLMINCALRYEILGHKIKKMGAMGTVDKASTKGKISKEKQNLFLRDFIAVIESHKYVSGITNELDSFLSRMFFVQLATSGLCICFSIYCLAFNNSENLIEYLFHLACLIYNVFDIFMIMYFGNEISSSSDRLSYCLFESDWVDQPQSTKQLIIIFGELIKQPHELVILTLYPLNLETFRRILNSAYSMFNILQSLK